MPGSANTRVDPFPQSQTSSFPTPLISSPSSPTSIHPALKLIGVFPSGLTPVSMSFAPLSGSPFESILFIETLTCAIVVADVVVDSDEVEAVVDAVVIIVVDVVGILLDVVVAETDVVVVVFSFVVDAVDEVFVLELVELTILLEVDVVALVIAEVLVVGLVVDSEDVEDVAVLFSVVLPTAVVVVEFEEVVDVDAVVVVRYIAVSVTTPWNGGSSTLSHSQIKPRSSLPYDVQALSDELHE